MSRRIVFATLSVTAVFLAAVVLFTWRNSGTELLVLAPASVAPAMSQDTGPTAAVPPLWLERTQRIDLNSAAAEELALLPGIGPSLALRIIEYRETYGPFSRLEDLLDVSGIGESVLEGIYAWVDF